MSGNQITAQSVNAGGRVAGKGALVTGGATGIGRACAERLAAEGAMVWVTDVAASGGAECVAAIREAGGTAEFMLHDVTQESAWQEVVAVIGESEQSLNILVNNAGIAIGGSILEMKLADWQKQQAVNLDGVFLGLKHCIPLLRDSGSGSIINMSSVAGMKGAPSLAAYNATKGGVRLLTKGVALECAGNRWPIRVNSVHPGIIATAIWEKMNPELSEKIVTEGANALDLETLAGTAVPTGELGYPSDIANAVLFLASEESRYMTGTEVVVDAGLCA